MKNKIIGLVLYGLFFLSGIFAAYVFLERNQHFLMPYGVLHGRDSGVEMLIYSELGFAGNDSLSVYFRSLQPINGKSTEDWHKLSRISVDTYADTFEDNQIKKIILENGQIKLICLGPMAIELINNQYQLALEKIDARCP